MVGLGLGKKMHRSIRNLCLGILTTSTVKKKELRIARKSRKIGKKPIRHHGRFPKLRGNKTGHDESVHSAKLVPLSEEGYQSIADLKNDNEMKHFIERMIKSDARYIKPGSGGNLEGIVPYYSGVQARQSLNLLKMELRNASWVFDGEGRTAALNDEGYNKILQTKSKLHKMVFAKRVLAANQRSVWMRLR